MYHIFVDVRKFIMHSSTQNALCLASINADLCLGRGAL